MPSTYSTNLRFELMATGEKSGTWGTISNTNIGTLIEQAISGVANVAHDDSANYSLTTGNGTTDEARNAVVRITGTLTAARNVVVPAVDKVYLIKNNTSGGYAITVKTSSGTGITVPNGETKLLYSDATNVVEAVDSLTNLTMAGDLTVNGSTTNLDSAVVINESGASVDFRVEGDTATHMLFVDGSADRVGINQSSPSHTLDVDGSARILSDNNATQLTLESSDADATEGPRLDLRRNSASPADDDQAGIIRFLAENDAGENITYSTIKSTLRDVTDGTEDAEVIFQNRIAGTLQAPIRIKPSEVAINDDQIDVDFRVESDTDTHALFVDAGNDRVGIGSASNVGKLLVSGDSGTGSNLGDGDTLISQQNKGFVSIENLNDTAGVESGITLRAKLNLAGAAAIYVRQTGDYQGDLIFRHRTAGSASNETFRIKHDATAQFHGNLNVLDPGGTTDVTLVADGGNLFLGPSAQAHSGISGVKLMASAGDSGVTPSGEVFIEDNAGVSLTLASPNTNASRINFADPEDFDVGEIEYDHSSNVMTFRAAGANKMYIASDGVRIGANAAANALDDIEDGTFSVTAERGGVSGTGTRETLDMRYFKVGRLVFIDFTAPESSTAPYFNVGSSGYSSGQSFKFASSGSNLPFTPKNSASCRLGKARSLSGINELGVGWRAGSGRIYLGEANDNEYVMHNTATTSLAQSNVTVQCTFCYYTNS
tara:strand:+ start:1070 stop:3214 length:2145 start_codon:yes stop_codon:yes gene_type:complete